MRIRACNIRKYQKNNVALEIGQRKFDARKIAFLRTFTIFTYVNVRQQKTRQWKSKDVSDLIHACIKDGEENTEAFQFDL